MTKEERELAIIYLEGIKEKYIEGDGYERHPLPEYYAIETAIKALDQEPILDKIRAEIKAKIEEGTDVADLPSGVYRPKGKWIKCNSYDRRDNFYTCSECGRIINVICNAHLEDYPFCHCGADMRNKE